MPEQRWETKERAQVVNTEFFCDFRSSTQTFSKVQRWRPIVWGYPTCGANQSAAGLLVYITFFQFPSTTSRWQGRVRWGDEREKRDLTWSKTSMWKMQPLCRVSNTNRKHQANTLIMLTIKATQSQSTSLSFTITETLRTNFNLSVCLHTKSYSLFAFNIHWENHIYCSSSTLLEKYFY